EDGERPPDPGPPAADRPAGTRLPLCQRRRGRTIMTTGRRRADNSQADEPLSRLYQQVTEQQAAWFAAEYDMAAGLARYRTWLGEHTAEEQARSAAMALPRTSAALPSSTPEKERPMTGLPGFTVDIDQNPYLPAGGRDVSVIVTVTADESGAGL